MIALFTLPHLYLSICSICSVHVDHHSKAVDSKIFELIAVMQKHHTGYVSDVVQANVHELGLEGFRDS